MSDCVKYIYFFNQHQQLNLYSYDPLSVRSSVSPPPQITKKHLTTALGYRAFFSSQRCLSLLSIILFYHIMIG